MTPILAAILSIALIGSGCGAGGAMNSGGVPTELTFSVLRQPQTFDLANLSEGQDAFIWTSIYDTLLKLDDDGNVQPNAADWKYSKDGRTLTLMLRDDLVFADGKAVTADHAAASLEHLRTTTGPSKNKLSKVTSIDAAAERTVVLKLSEPDPALLVNLTFAIGAIGDPETFDEQLSPNGSGPYTLNKAETKQGTQYVLDRKDKHWNLDQYPFEKVTIRVIADSTATENALIAGELDLGIVDPTGVDPIKAAGFQITELKAASVLSLKILDREGTMVPALADVRVRKAINKAVDRAGLVKAVLRGHGVASEQYFAPGQPGHVPELNDTYGYDPKGAKKLLADAGYPNGFSVTMPSLVYTKQMEPNIAQALADIGIEVKWTPVPAQQTQTAIVGGEYPMVLWFDGINAPGRLVETNYFPSGAFNPLRSKDPDLTALFDKAAARIDPAAQTPVYEDINRFVVDNAWDAPLLFNAKIWATAPGYTYHATVANQFSTLQRFGVAE